MDQFGARVDCVVVKVRYFFGLEEIFIDEEVVCVLVVHFCQDVVGCIGYDFWLLVRVDY